MLSLCSRDRFPAEGIYSSRISKEGRSPLPHGFGSLRVRLNFRISIVTSLSRSTFKDLLALAHDLADQSRAAIRPHFRKQMAVDNKAGAGGFDPVTRADQGAERAIVRLLRSRVPEHGIIGEEYG